MNAVESSTYIEFLDSQSAHTYLTDLLSKQFKHKFLSLEAEIVKQYQSAASNVLAD